MSDLPYRADDAALGQGHGVPDPELEDRLRRAIADVARAPVSKLEPLVSVLEHLDGLDSATVGEIRSVTGITGPQAKRIRDAFSFARSWEAVRHRRRGIRIDNPLQAGLVARSLIYDATRMKREAMVVLALDARSRLLACTALSTGTIDSVSVVPRDVFGWAVAVGASAVILAHNHPSGCAEPSDADIELTHRVADAGRLLGVPLVDHLVIVVGGCQSVRRWAPDLFRMEGSR